MSFSFKIVVTFSEIISSIAFNFVNSWSNGSIVITLNEAHAKSIRYRIVALPATIPFTITSMRDPVSVEFPAPESK